MPSESPKSDRWIQFCLMQVWTAPARILENLLFRHCATYRRYHALGRLRDRRGT
jgi:hypothetical protein